MEAAESKSAIRYLFICLFINLLDTYCHDAMLRFKMQSIIKKMWDLDRGFGSFGGKAEVNLLLQANLGLRKSFIVGTRIHFPFQRFFLSIF